MVTLDELDKLLTSHQWRISPIRRYQTTYMYAKKRIDGKVKTRYLTTERKLDQLTHEEVLRRIQINKS